MYRVTKTFGHDLGLSAAFRQWRAQSHCKRIHGYALSFALTFEAATLDDRNWVVDFGDFTEIKNGLKQLFDHKLLVAADDPERVTLEALGSAGIADVEIVQAVGCEAFAEIVFNNVARWLARHREYGRRVQLVLVEVCEHGANKAGFRP